MSFVDSPETGGQEYPPTVRPGFRFFGGLEATGQLSLPNGLTHPPDLPPPVFPPPGPTPAQSPEQGGREYPPTVRPGFSFFAGPEATGQLSLPNGLTHPPDLPPPALPNGLTLPPDLPHPDVVAADQHSKAMEMAAKAAPALGIDFSEASDQQRAPINPMKAYPPQAQTESQAALSALRQALPAAAAAKRADILGAVEDVPTQVARTLGEKAATLGERTVQGITQMPEYLATLPQQPPSSIALGLIGGLGEVPLGEVGAAGRAAGAAVKYDRTAPPPRTTELPPAEAVAQAGRPYTDWHAKVADLDAHNDPDEKYRLILSTGSKETKANGAPRDAPTWRDKVIGMINQGVGAGGPVREPGTVAAPAGGGPPPRAAVTSPGRPGIDFGVGIDPTRVGEIQGDSILGFNTNTGHVRLVNGAEEPVAVGGGTIWGKGGSMIDPRVITHFKNNIPGADWVPVKGATVKAPVTPITPAERVARATGREPPTVVTDKKVPYGAGSSNDGSTVYIDPIMAEKMSIEGRLGGKVTIDPTHPLAVHEGVEHDLMTTKGMPYETAHREALRAEQQVVEQMGGKWSAYQEQMQQRAAQTQKQAVGPGEAPPDLYTKPYPHAEAEFLQRQGQATAAPAGATPSPAEPTAAAAPPAGTPQERIAQLEAAPPFQARPREAPPGGGGRQPPTAPPAAPSAERPLPPQMPRDRVNEMENDLFSIRSRDNMRREMAFDRLRRLRNVTPEIDRGAYHGGEGAPMSPQAKDYFDKVIQPMRESNNAIRDDLVRMGRQDAVNEIGPLDDPNYMHRMRVGKTAGMDEASGLGETVGYGKRSLSQSPSSTRARSIFTMEDATGNRKVVTAYPGGDGVYVWENGKPTRTTGSFIRTKPSETTPEEIIPGRTTLPRPVPARARMEPEVEPKKQGALTKAYTLPSREVPDRVRLEKTTPPELVNDTFRPGSEFVDMNNKRWFIKQATTQEIHDAGVRSRTQEFDEKTGKTKLYWGDPIRYHESALASVMTDQLALEKARDNARFMEKWQNSPEFKRYSVDYANATPEQRRGWVQIPAPGWEGRYYEPRFAEPILDYMNGPGFRIPYLDAINNFATASLFKTGIGSIAHLRNEQWQRFQARGWGNLNIPSRIGTFHQALDESLNKGPIWQDYRNKGASFPSDQMHWRSLEEKILQTVGHKAASDPAIIGLAKRVGMGIGDVLHAFEFGVGKMVFEYGDFIALQHGLELERRGFTREQAIARMNRVLPTYRLPSRVGTEGVVGRGVSKMLGSRSLTMFGRFEYSKFKALSSIVGDMLGSRIAGRSNMAERWDAVGRAAAIGTALAVFGPLIANPILRRITGDENAHMLYGGTIGMLARVARSVDDVIAGRKNVFESLMDVVNITNIAPATKEIMQQLSGPHGTDWFTGQPIVAPKATGLQDVLERAGHAAPQLFNPLAAVKDPGRYLVKEPLGVSTSKPFVPIMRPGAARRQQFQEMARERKDPNWMRRLYGGTQ